MTESSPLHPIGAGPDAAPAGVGGTVGAARAPRALVIEDAPEFRRSARILLEREGFEVLEAEDGESGLAAARQQRPDLVLIDVLLPGMDGFDVCRELRTFTDAYAIMVTGCDDEVDKVVGLRVGADDYVTKPYSAPELVARIAAVRRRPRVAPAPEAVHGDLVVDDVAREVRAHGVPVALTRTEYDLVAVLVAEPRRVVTRAQLREIVWGDRVGDLHVVDVHVGNMRRKVRAALGGTEPFVTVRGVGYRFEPPAG
ncbi:response regulator transcription factor [Nocardioides sp.]|uniref:response regulator transcription factor n=1 Tax=Nocardioides sp. TaxID=35761 RepID=UPI003514AEAA